MNNPLAIIAEVAARYVGLREKTPNQTPELQQFWDVTSYPKGMKNREPWCSAFATFTVRQADKESEAFNLPVPPTFPAVMQWIPWAVKIGALVFPATSTIYAPQAGDIVIFLPRLSHIGIVESYNAATRNVMTIEGNTNADGGREGDGVYRKRRHRTFCGSFIRLPLTPRKA